MAQLTLHLSSSDGQEQRTRLLRHSGQGKLCSGRRRASLQRCRLSGPSGLSDMANNSWAIAATWLFLGAPFSNIWAASSTVIRDRVPYTIDVWDTETEVGLPQNSVIAM